MVLLVGVALSATAVLGQSKEPSYSEQFAQHHNIRSPHNAASCAECHAVPSVGGSGQLAVIRTEYGVVHEYRRSGESKTKGTTDSPNRNVSSKTESLRIVLNLLGDGYVEAIPDTTLMAIASQQRVLSKGQIHGSYSLVTLPEKRDGKKAMGRFGWKGQHGSILSAAADALANELGVANSYFQPATFADVPQSDHLSNTNPESSRDELESFVRFIRSTPPIEPDPQQRATASSVDGAMLFDKVGCGLCHVGTLRTAPAGASLHDGSLIVPASLGDKVIHPFSDFLLHDVGTGDGLVQNIEPQDYDPATANKFRTPPLWGLRYRAWLMHDGKSASYHQSIMRHGGEATSVVQRYDALTPREKQNLQQFLSSL